MTSRYGTDVGRKLCVKLFKALRQSRSEVAALSYRPDIQQDQLSCFLDLAGQRGALRLEKVE